MEADTGADVALLQAAIELADDETATERASFYAYARRGRPEATAQVSRDVEVRHRGQAYRIVVSQLAPNRYRTEVDGPSSRSEVERLSGHERRITIDGVTHRTLISARAPTCWSRSTASRTASPATTAASSAPAVRPWSSRSPSAEGDEVAEGDVVAVVESMKMETSLTAPFAGRVRRVLSGTNVQVPAHTPLLQLEAIEDEAAESSAERVVVRRRGGVQRGRAEAAIDRLRCALLGYDVCGDEVRRALAVLRECDTDVTAAEQLAAGRLHRRARSDARPPRRSRARAPAQPAGVPARVPALARREGRAAPGALRHPARARALALRRREPGPHPALEDACYRLFVSQGRADLARAAVMAILEKRLERADEFVGKVERQFRGVLDRLELATERRDPVIADHARQLRNRYYDQPVIVERQAAGLRRAGAPSGGAAGGPASAPTARSTSAPSSRRRSCSPRSSSTACRTPPRASTRCCWRS